MSLSVSSSAISTASFSSNESDWLQWRLRMRRNCRDFMLCASASGECVLLIEIEVLGDDVRQIETVEIVMENLVAIVALEHSSQIRLAYMKESSGNRLSMVDNYYDVIDKSNQMRNEIDFCKNVNGQLKYMLPNRPKRLLVFSCEKSGSGRGVGSIFPKMRKLFNLANIAIVEHRTRRRNDVKDCLAAGLHYQMSQFDGIVAVGGDGLLHEVLNGAFLAVNDVCGIKDANQIVKPNIRIGVIPSGTSDCMSCTLNGTRDETTSILAIIRGRTRSVDVPMLFDETGSFYCLQCSCLGFGAMGKLVTKMREFHEDGLLYRFRAIFASLLVMMSAKPIEVEITFTPCQLPDTRFRQCLSECFCDSSPPPVALSPPLTIKRRIYSAQVIPHAMRSAFQPTGAMPFHHVADGLVWLMLVDATGGATAWIRFIISNLRFILQDVSAMSSSNVTLHLARDITIKNMSSKPDERLHWNVDGEPAFTNQFRVVMLQRKADYYHFGLQKPNRLLNLQKLSTCKTLTSFGHSVSCLYGRYRGLSSGTCLIIVAIITGSCLLYIASTFFTPS